jgi:hypothetical protein
MAARRQLPDTSLISRFSAESRQSGYRERLSIFFTDWKLLTKDQGDGRSIFCAEGAMPLRTEMTIKARAKIGKP